MDNIKVEKATESHSSILVDMIVELARFEKMEDSVATTPQKIADDLNRGAVHGLVLYENDIAAAMVLYYYAYSSWDGKYIHMEDLYVRPDYRRKGYGGRLWKELAKISKVEVTPRIQWCVLDWNTNAIDFYKKMPIMDITNSSGVSLYTMNADAIDLLANSV